MSHRNDENPEAVLLTEEESKRAAMKAMSLLQFKDRTEKELSEKLYRAGFSEKALTEAMQYVKHFGYVNDKRYVENYLMFQKGKKSRKEIFYKLAGKGVSKEFVWQVMEETEYPGEEEAIRNLVMKRLKGRVFHELTAEEKQTLSMYLGRKGYEWKGIKNVFSQLDNLP